MVQNNPQQRSAAWLHYFPPRRVLIPLVVAALVAASAAWALSLAAVAPADFTFVNETELKSVDPALVTGKPEGRIVSELFEGLVGWHPKTLDPIPGVAERWEISADGLEYTFFLRPTARWSDGSPVTAQDFVYSFRRMLDPLVAAEYSYQLWYIRGARKYNVGPLAPGDKVEVELNERPQGALPEARGRILKGKLRRVDAAPGTSERTYTVLIAGQERRFGRSSPSAQDYKQILLDFDEVGIRAIDRLTLRLKLAGPTPFFLRLLGFYPFSPVNRRCVERYGYPAWTKPENIVTNGPYHLASRRIRDRIRLVKSPTYWDRKNVRLAVIDALAVESAVTALNLYLTGKVDWVPTVPMTIFPDLVASGRKDFYPTREFTTYFYRFNVTKPPLDNPLVRRALALAVDREQIVRVATHGASQAARSLVPPGLEDYTSPLCAAYDPAEARKLLSRAGYPGGRGFPRITILYNNQDTHQSVAELVQDQWKRNLGVRADLHNQEWGAYLDSVRHLQFTVCRAGWVGDYLDPNTFLDMFVTGGANNQTGWGSPAYDKLIARATMEADPRRRLDILHDAEAILLDELPIMPIYFRVSQNLVRPTVKGFYPNLQDVHPLAAMWIQRDAQPKALARAR